MTRETQHWRENRAEVEKIALYPRNRVNHAADLWTVNDCWRDLRGIHANRWTPETRELLYIAREALDALDRAMGAVVVR